MSRDNVLNLHPSLLLRRKGTLNSLRLPSKLLQGTVVTTDVNPGLLLDHLGVVLHHTLVKVFAAEVGVTVGR